MLLTFYWNIKFIKIGEERLFFACNMKNIFILLFLGNTCEMKLVSQIFEFVRGIAELELTETALALYSAYILLQHGKSEI